MAGSRKNHRQDSREASSTSESSSHVVGPGSVKMPFYFIGRVGSRAPTTGMCFTRETSGCQLPTSATCLPDHCAAPAHPNSNLLGSLRFRMEAVGVGFLFLKSVQLNVEVD